MNQNRFAIGDKVVFTNTFGVCWGEKDKMTISIKGGEIAFSFENKTISIQV